MNAHFRHGLAAACLASTLSFTAGPAHASCGATTCTLMTDRYAQGAGELLGWSVDLRLETVTQDGLRSGTSNIDAGQVSGEEAIELHTKNLNIVATLGYGFSREWSLALRLPAARRDHQHDLLDEETGARGPSEEWRFTRPGDVQVLARRQFGGENGAASWAVSGGLKLPTGATGVTNGDGSRAERSLQPGSGTTDAVLGAATRHVLGLADALFGQAGVAWALNSHEDYKPGTRVDFTAGWSHALSESLGAVLQANLRRRGRDSGRQAEPRNSGSTTLDISPGLTLGAGHASTLYAYVQLPLYQKVNGIQLVPRHALALGWTADF